MELDHRFGRWLSVEAESRTAQVLREACLLDQVGEAEEAMACLGEALGDLGPCPSLLEARGALYLAAGFPRAAVGDFQAALDLAPGRANAWFALGHAHLQLGLARQALTSFDQARNLGLVESVLLLDRARTLRKLARPGAAAKDYVQALAGNPELTFEILVEALTLSTSDPARCEAALALAERLEACRGTTLSDEAWLLRALARELAGEQEEGVRTAVQALDCSPTSQAQIAVSLLTALQLLDPETGPAAREEWIAGEPNPDRRLRLERCLAATGEASR